MRASGSGSSSVTGAKRKKKLQDLVGGGGGGYVVNDATGGAEMLEEMMQSFYGVVEAELRREVHRGATAEQGDGPERPGREEDKGNEGEKGSAARVEEQAEEEARIRDVLETVEATLCSLLYDRYARFTTLGSHLPGAQAVYTRGERRRFA